MKVTVVGAGSWGTAASRLLAQNGHDVTVWAKEPEVAQGINQTHHNPLYLKDVGLPESIVATNDLETALRGSQLVVFVVVSHAMREVVRKAKEFVDDDMIFISLTKGVETDSLMRMSEVIKDELGEKIIPRLAVLSGPNHAEEVSREMPSATVVAAVNASTRETLQKAFMAPYFRVYTNPDIVGVEIGGAAKNIVAMAAGMSDGLGFGDNSKASLMTRGLTEITRLGVKMGSNPLTFSGLAGVGDLVVTCFSKLSRNRFVGEEIAKGSTVDEVTHRMNMVAEGIHTTKAVYSLSKEQNISMPITELVYKVLYEGKSAGDCVQELMMRAATDEAVEAYLP